MSLAAELDVHCFGSPGGRTILLLHTWWGRNAAMTAWAEFFAENGLRVVVPDFFHGKVARTIPEAQVLLDTLDEGALLRSLQDLAEEIAEADCPWTAMGFSMGAGLACQLAGRGLSGPDQLVLFYGGDTPDAIDIRTRRVEMHVVPEDVYFTGEELESTLSAFRAAGSKISVTSYPGAQHWFAEEGSPGYSPDDAGQARRRVLEQVKAGITAGDA